MIKKISVLFVAIPMAILAAPSSPSDLRFSDVSSTSATLHWKDNAHNESGFKVYRKNKLISLLKQDVTTYTDTNLKLNTVYQYTVKATDDKNHINTASVSSGTDALSLDMSGIFWEDFNFLIYIDSDNNPQTGYDNGSIHGADYLVSKHGLYKYPANANGWDWEYIINDMSLENRKDNISITIPLAHIAHGDLLNLIATVSDENWKNTSVYNEPLQVSLNSSAFGVATFHSLSLYWTPESASIDKKVLIQYKESNQGAWKEGYPMVYNPISKENLNQMNTDFYDDRIDKLAMSAYRGSIVNLKPNQEYDIKLQLENSNETTSFKISTWSEQFSVAETINIASSHVSYSVDRSGTKGGYILYDGTGSTIDASSQNSANIVIKNGVHHVIIRGIELKNGDKAGIILEGNNHDIIIEKCDISNWGRLDSDAQGNGFGQLNDSAIMVDNVWIVNNINKIIIQKNKIHNPKYSSNDWSQSHRNTFHPGGPQAITLGQAVRGNNVIRYNEIYAGENRCFNDIMAGYANGSYTGFLGSDSDIYGNYLSGACDDAIEVEGNDINIRIWHNYITNSYQGIGNALVSVGPLYVWRNIFAKSKYVENGQFGEYASAIKGGYPGMENYEDFMDGYTYFFNNTILQMNNDGFSGIAIGNHHIDQLVRHFVARNNILQARDNDDMLSIHQDNRDYSYDYDLINRPFQAGFEEHGVQGLPTYTNLYFDFDLMQGDFRLAANSLGLDSGEILPNFTDNYKNQAPDMGACELGDEPLMRFGIEYFE